MATQLYAKKWLIYASYALQPKKIWANCGLAVNPSFKVLKYIKSVKKTDFSTVPQILMGLSYLGQRLKIVSLHNILFGSILTLGAKLDSFERHTDKMFFH